MFSILDLVILVCVSAVAKYLLLPSMTGLLNLCRSADGHWDRKYSTLFSADGASDSTDDDSSAKKSCLRRRFFFKKTSDRGCDVGSDEGSCDGDSEGSSIASSGAEKGSYEALISVDDETCDVPPDALKSMLKMDNDASHAGRSGKKIHRKYGIVSHRHYSELTDEHYEPVQQSPRKFSKRSISGGMSQVGIVRPLRGVPPALPVRTLSCDKNPHDCVTRLTEQSDNNVNSFLCYQDRAPTDNGLSEHTAKENRGSSSWCRDGDPSFWMAGAPGKGRRAVCVLNGESIYENVSLENNDNEVNKSHDESVVYRSKRCLVGPKSVSNVVTLQPRKSYESEMMAPNGSVSLPSEILWYPANPRPVSFENHYENISYIRQFSADDVGYFTSHSGSSCDGFSNKEDFTTPELTGSESSDCSAKKESIEAIKLRQNSHEIRAKRSFHGSWNDPDDNLLYACDKYTLSKELETTNALKQQLKIASRKKTHSMMSLGNERDRTISETTAPREKNRYLKSQSCILASAPLAPQKQHDNTLCKGNSKDNLIGKSSSSCRELRFGNELPTRVGSCIFTETMGEDFTPYMPTGFLPSPSKSSPGRTPRASSGVPSVSPRRCMSSSSLYGPNKTNCKENIKPPIDPPDTWNETEDTSRALEDKFQRQPSLRKVLRRASSVNKDLRRRIKSWSPFTSKFEIKEFGSSSFYTSLHDDHVKEEPEEHTVDSSDNKTRSGSNYVKLGSQDLNLQIVNSKEQKNRYNEELGGSARDVTHSTTEITHRAFRERKTASLYGTASHGYHQLSDSVIFPWRRNDQSRERELSSAGCQTDADQSRAAPQPGSNVETNQDGTTRVLISSNGRRTSALNRRSESCPGPENLSLQKPPELGNLNNLIPRVEDHNSLGSISAVENRNNNEYDTNRSVARQEGKTGREGRRRPSKDGGVQTNNKRNVSNSPVYRRASRSSSQWDTLSPAGGEYAAEEAGDQLSTARQRPVTANHHNTVSTNPKTSCNTSHSIFNNHQTTCNNSHTSFNNSKTFNNSHTAYNNSSYNNSHLNFDNTSNYNTSNTGYASLNYVNNSSHTNHSPHSKSIGTQCSPEDSESDLNSTFSSHFDEVQLVGNGRTVEVVNPNVMVNQSSVRSTHAYNGAEYIDGSLVDHLNNPAGIEGEDQAGHQSLPHMTQLELQQHLQQRHDSSVHLNVAPNSGMFQKFKKSLSLRLTKKSGSRSESPSEGPSCSGPPQCAPPEAGHLEPATLPRRRGSAHREEDKAMYLFGQPVFRSSKDRRKARLRDARASKCSSGDSGDSGIEIAGIGALSYTELVAEGPATSIFRVSVGDHCVDGDGDAEDGSRRVNGDDGSCRIPIPCDCCNASNNICNHEQPCPSCSVSCSYGSVQVLGSNSRQSVASTSSTTISSSLDSSNTSVTTISYGGPTQHPSLTSCGSESTQCPCVTDPRNNDPCSCDGSNRSSFHAQSCLRSTIPAAPPKIRRCQSDVTSSINNLNNAGRSARNNQENKICAAACDKDAASSRLGNRARLSATGRAMTDGGAGVRRSERRSEDENASRNKSLKRSQGSTHLRRSVSQPLDLNKSPVEGGSVSALRVSSRPVCGVTAHLHSYPHKRPQRRPSTGNLLNDDHTTSEEELLPSDTEEARRERTIDESCGVVYAEALWDHVTMDSEELMFRAGELISVVDRTDHDWWWGRISSRSGWFPVAFVRLLVNQQEHLASSQDLEVTSSRDDLALAVDQTEPHEEQLDTTLTDNDGSCTVDVFSCAIGNNVNGCSRGYTRAVSQYSAGATPRKASVSGPTHDQIRANVIREIITTERDFVKHLRDVVEGYLKQARRRPDMFSTARISAIFGNMEELFAFQTRFLADLEACIDWEVLHKSCVGEAFIKNSDKFEIYSEYCNNHPFAVSELQELYQQEKYVHFFEACRLLQEMIDISLDGFLLTPVQKICKYPLQLQELLKYTKPDHPDHSSVQGALNAMRAAALLVNERRRRMECLEKIAAWQMELEGWEGAELLDSSSQLLHQGEVVKGAGGAWPKEVTLFLFDRQLVYCKKDIIKRNTYVYRGRINLDQCTVEDIGDGKDGSRSNYVPNAWRIRCKDKNKSYVFACKTFEEKAKWLEAFRRERELVAGDEEAGFLVSDKTRELAREAARTRRARPKKPRSSKIANKRCQALTHAQAEMLVNIDREQRSNSLPSHQQQQQQLSNTAPLSATIVSADTSSDNKRRGLWFGFGGQKKSRSQSRGGEQHQQAAQQQPTLV